MERAEEKLLKIGEVAQLMGFPAKTLHFYEEQEILKPAARTEAGYRLYGREEVARLEFVKRAKLLGLTLKEIKELLDLAAEASRGKMIPRLEDVLEAKLEEIERRMAELAKLREGLLYYSERAFETDPVENCGCREGVSFCSCLEAVTGEGGALINVESLRRKT